MIHKESPRSGEQNDETPRGDVDWPLERKQHRKLVKSEPRAGFSSDKVKETL